MVSEFLHDLLNLCEGGNFVKEISRKFARAEKHRRDACATRLCREA
jgi:hypothetical protein